MVAVAVPVMLFVSSLVMAFAWLGHVRFRTRSFRFSLVISWLMVLPEYILNVTAFRWGNSVYAGAQMAAFNMAMDQAKQAQAMQREHMEMMEQQMMEAEGYHASERGVYGN